MADRILEGIKVLDFTNNIAGPLTCGLLREHGAEVIHIEKPGYGDDSRHWKPIFNDDLSVCYMWINKGKKSVVMDLKDPKAKEIIYEMIKTADVLVESYKPGVMDKLGYGYEKAHELNPRLVYCSVSAFGHTGPNSNKPGYDIIAQAYSGIMDATGDPDGSPYMIGASIGDNVGAINGYGSVMTALFHRERTGKGQHVDVALSRGLLFNIGFFSAEAGLKRGRAGKHSPYNCPYGIFNSSHGSCVIGAINQKTWVNLCKAMEMPELLEDPEFATDALRHKHRDRLIPIMEGWLESVGDIDEAVRRIDVLGVPVYKINSNDEVYKDPHAIEAGWVRQIPTPMSVKERRQISGCVGLADFSEAELDYTAPAPELGENTVEVLKSMGVGAEEAEALAAKWANKG